MKHVILLLFLGFGALQAQTAIHLYADSAHAPFYWGVASGDPSDSSVIIWTKSTSANVVVWQVSSDSAFSAITQTGNIFPDSSHDFTIQLKVNSLAPDTRYYFRFIDYLGRYSMRGRTHTMPRGPVSKVGLAVFSCSSVYSGYFNAYRAASTYDSLLAFVHLGDFIYDFIDPQERVRIPASAPVNPTNLNAWRDIYKMYYLDPDLRKARAEFPFIQIWDNHDVTNNSSRSAAVQAFREYVPVDWPPQTDTFRIYRKKNIGNLADIFMIDDWLYKTDTFSDGSTNMLGSRQEAWLFTGLNNSTATWKIMGVSKTMCGWYTKGFDPFVLALVPNDGDVFNGEAWDGFPTSRYRLLNHIRTQRIQNIMTLSGDMHYSLKAELSETPTDTNTYDRRTGNGSVGVEFAPTSVSRGNFDESGLPPSLVNTTLPNLNLKTNPHQLWQEYTSHGFGILWLYPDSSVAEWHATPILSIDSSDELLHRDVVLKDQNRWYRPGIETGTDVKPAIVNHTWKVYPNPSEDMIILENSAFSDEKVRLCFYQMNGARIRETFEAQTLQGKVQISLNGLPFGDLLLRISGSGVEQSIQIVHSKSTR